MTQTSLNQSQVGQKSCLPSRQTANCCLEGNVWALSLGVSCCVISICYDHIG